MPRLQMFTCIQSLFLSFSHATHVRIVAEAYFTRDLSFFGEDCFCRSEKSSTRNCTYCSGVCIFENRKNAFNPFSWLGTSCFLPFCSVYVQKCIFVYEVCAVYFCFLFFFTEKRTSIVLTILLATLDTVYVYKYT